MCDPASQVYSGADQQKTDCNKHVNFVPGGTDSLNIERRPAFMRIRLRDTAKGPFGTWNPMKQLELTKNCTGTTCNIRSGLNATRYQDNQPAGYLIFMSADIRNRLDLAPRQERHKPGD